MSPINRVTPPICMQVIFYVFSFPLSNELCFLIYCLIWYQSSIRSFADTHLPTELYQEPLQFRPRPRHRPPHFRPSCRCPFTVIAPPLLPRSPLQHPCCCLLTIASLQPNTKPNGSFCKTCQVLLLQDPWTLLNPVKLT